MVEQLCLNGLPCINIFVIKKIMNFLDLGLHLLTWTNCNPCMDMYLYQVYSVGWNNFQQISTVQLLTLENEYVFSSHNLLGMWLLIHAGI